MEKNMKQNAHRGKHPFKVLSSILLLASAVFLRILALLQIRDPHMVLALACPAILQGAIAAHLAALDLHLSHDLGGITFASADSCSVWVLFTLFVLLVLSHFPPVLFPFPGFMPFCLNYFFILSFAFPYFDYPLKISGTLVDLPFPFPHKIPFGIFPF